MTEASTAERWVEYVPLTELKFAEINPKEHDTVALIESVKRFGFTEAGLLDERTGRMCAGHGRAGALAIMHAQGDPPPPGVQLHADGSWAIPLIRGWSSKDDREAEAYLIASNRHVIKGGWDDRELASLLRDMPQDLRDAAGYGQQEVNDLLAAIEANDRDYGGGPAGPPSDEFPPFDDSVKTEYRCPSCKYEWNGQPR